MRGPTGKYLRTCAIGVVVFFAIVGALWILTGCAVGMRVNPDGSESPVVGFSLGSWSGEQIGGAVGTFLGAVGVPGATAIGTAVTGGLALLGYGAKRVVTNATNARIEAATVRGKELGWEERERAAAIQQPLPSTGV